MATTYTFGQIERAFWEQFRARSDVLPSDWLLFLEALRRAADDPDVDEPDLRPWGRCTCGYEGPHDCHRPPRSDPFAHHRGAFGYCTVAASWTATTGTVRDRQVLLLARAGFHEFKGLWHRRGEWPLPFSAALREAERSESRGAA